MGSCSINHNKSLNQHAPTSAVHREATSCTRASGPSRRRCCCHLSSLQDHPRTLAAPPRLIRDSRFFLILLLIDLMCHIELKTSVCVVTNHPRGRFRPRRSGFMSCGFVSPKSGTPFGPGCIDGGMLERIFSFSHNDSSHFRSNTCHGLGRRHVRALFHSASISDLQLKPRCSLVSWRCCSFRA